MASNHLTIKNETREFVWEIEQEATPKPSTTKRSNTRKRNEPTLVKDAVARYFNKISEGLYERLEALEKQLNTLEKENTQLRETCAISCYADQQYVSDSIYNPWYS